MSVSIEKNGVVSSSGNGVNPNLAHNTYGLEPFSVIQVEYKAYDIGLMDVSDGETVTVSFDVDMIVNTETHYLRVYNTNNKGPHQISGINVLDKRTIPVGEFHERLSVTTTINNRASADIKRQTDVIEFYSDYSTENEIFIHNIKVERGSVPTPWCPNETDDIYVGSTLGFTEAEDTPSIGKAGYVQATEFIEW